ncbi:hypothetical protein GCM10011578_073780 [Streptomyces fuscichromogenes]|uniref:Uncharacterized protein n=1 Tax=Streptomyces fuscichromogenes TaxID=1324013 RepID=A0A918CVL4_9ACTN|nr:hypothetical protein GCM10011578_073780 [Streptomyces fuscichromogenes]
MRAGPTMCGYPKAGVVLRSRNQRLACDDDRRDERSTALQFMQRAGRRAADVREAGVHHG